MICDTFCAELCRTDGVRKQSVTNRRFGAVIRFGRAMIQIKRFLLLLVIAFAVPVQGMAAVGAGICMAFGHHDAPGHVADHDHDVAGSTEVDPAGGDTDQGDAHCGPCVSCCGVASIASPALAVVPIVSGLVMQPHYADRVAGLVPDSLDRPPLPR